MNIIKNGLIFIISPIIITLIYWGFTKVFFWMGALNTFWMIVAILFLSTVILGLFAHLVEFLMKMLVTISPNVSFSYWVIRVLSVVLALIQLYFVWSHFGEFETKIKVLTIIYSLFMIYLVVAFKNGLEKAYWEDL